MTDQTTTDKRTWKRTLLYLLGALLVAYLLANVALLASHVDEAGAATDPQAALDTATTIDSEALAPISLNDMVITNATIPSGCHGRVWRRSSIKLAVTGTVVAWRQTAIDRWCGNTKGVIYDWGNATGDDGKWAAAPYCWYDATPTKQWWTASKSEARVANPGTLRVCGKVSLGKTVSPKIYFHAATTTRRYLHWNYGGTVVYH